MIQKSGADGKSPQYGGPLGDVNEGSPRSAIRSASNSFARPPAVLPSTSTSTLLSNQTGLPSPSMFITSPGTSLAYLHASSTSSLPMSAFGGSPSASPLSGYGSLPQFTTVSPSIGYSGMTPFGTPPGMLSSTTYGLSPGGSVTPLGLMGTRSMIGVDGSPVDAAAPHPRRRVATRAPPVNRTGASPLSPMTTFADFE
jgi:hypothetical protein